jgi:hypothetical protein
MTEQFTLQNDEPRRKPRSIESNPKTRQEMLLAGLDRLPGQMDLFPTEGYEQDGADRSASDDAGQFSAS